MAELIKQAYLRTRCRLLHLSAPVIRTLRRRHRGLPGPAARILFIRTDRIGDLVLSTPAFRALKKAFPRSHLTVLASRVNYPLLDHNPHVDRVLVYPPGKCVSSKWRLARALKKEAFDLVIDPLAGYDLEPALLAYATGARRLIGFEGFGREVFLDRVSPASPSGRRFVDAGFDLLGLLGMEDTQRQPELFMTSAESDWAENWLSAHVQSGRMRVGIHPGAHYETQKWGVANFAGLIRFLQSTADVEWILIGGPADEAIVHAIRAAAGAELPFCIDGNLRRTIALISRLDALVCNNSGPLHIATALNVPTVSFMGPTLAVRWWPVGPHCRVLRAGHLSCLGCEKGTCPKKSTDCMRSITPAMASEALMSLLAETGQRSAPFPLSRRAHGSTGLSGARPLGTGGVGRNGAA